MVTPEQVPVGGAVARWGGRVTGLAGSCHPGPVVAVTTLMAALAVTAGQGGPRCILTAAAVLTGQLSAGWCNDAYDAHRDTATGRHDKPVAAGTVSVTTAWSAAFLALALCVPLSLACGLRAGAVHLGGVAAAWAYDLRLKATVWSWAPYAVGFGSLPAFVALGAPQHPWPAWWLVTAGALLGIGAHLGDVLPDIGRDQATGVRGWPQRLGTRNTRLLLPVPLVAASAILVMGPAGSPGGWGVAAITAASAVSVAGMMLGRRWEQAAFASAVCVAAMDVALLLLRGTSIA
ncbi:UbiA family prenyltransferase [Streptomyces sp. H10-C2]|uniref:UbiA family prenyltransferase n=1 Tax=unclassified Streptomyces TaxID=2593676 RepID=UPI0024B913E3|nr:MULTISPECIES: UbiA family prenyltransferase [unclassified Streptomyces]MDJ0344456.1 UbiA family prenyltransferase [Streptomyces sp. PH10-H1]MDJ0372068.1 UbiA family prenyltransferase [Streptomyces sp. H10-C2]